MRAIIVGGGIGGLTTAIALESRGIESAVYEAAPVLKEVGAGIWVPPNAMNVFERLGLAAKIKAAGKVVEEICVGTSKGEVWQKIVASEVIKRFGNATTTIHRGRLQKLLFEAVDPGTVHLDKRFTHFADDGQEVEVFFADGTSAKGDLLLAADGIHSAARRQLFGEIPLRYSGQTCWRAATTFRLPDPESKRMFEMWGPGAGLRFAYSQMTETEVYFYATVCEASGQKDVPGEVKGRLKKQYAEFGGLLGEIIDSAEEESIIRTDLFDFQPLHDWTHGHVALLGDAAHATTPNLGQGGAQAVEDSYVVAKCLAHARSIPAALKEYQAIRRPKAAHVVNTSWQYGQMTNWSNPVATWFRSFLMRRMPKKLGERQLRTLYELNF
jgi:2-polyprenyl-6-methoxyphenol hydroxylase-like FAD-dependent oxidoreductase